MPAKKLIKFKDLEGNPISETFWFNLSKAEIAEMEMSAEGGSLSAMLQEIIKNNDPAGIISTFKLIILKAYGVRSDDGKRLIKSPELSKEFSETDAYSELFMELVTKADEAAAFIAAVVPQEVQDHLKKGGTVPAVADIQLPPTRQEENASIIENAPYLQPGQNAPYLELPAKGNGPLIEFGPFEGLTQEQVNNMSKDEQATYITSPEAFKQQS